MKLSTRLFHWRMKENNSKMSGIGRLVGTSPKTLFWENTYKIKIFTRRIRPNEWRFFLKSIQLSPKKGKECIWTHESRDSMNETSKFKVESCRPKTMVFQALTFDTESWKPTALGFWDSTFNIESWIPWALCSSSSTFGIKSWILRTLWSLFSTFDTKSWKPKELGFRFSTFGVKSWKPITKCSWSSTFDTKSLGLKALKVGNQELSVLGPQLLTPKV